MKNIDYRELDDAICAFLAERDGHPTISCNLCKLAEKFTNGEPWRLIDRRLQVLRKSGRIEFTGRGRNASSKRLHGWTVLQLHQKNDV